jgi:uncharacterized protein YqgV (UPF0045/DUF77 family)
LELGLANSRVLFREQFEAELKEKLREKDREKEEVEATLCLKIKEMEHVEAALRGEIEDLRSDLIRKESDRENLEANLHGHIEELQKKLQEKDVDYELLETTLTDKIKELTNNVKEAHGAKMRAVFKRHLDIRKFSEKLEKTQSKEKRNTPSMSKGRIMRGSFKKEIPKVKSGSITLFV